MTRVVVTGLGGRMGSALARLLPSAEGLTWVAAVDRHQGEAPVPVLTGLEDALTRHPADVVIDFTGPAASAAHAKICAARRVAMVIGTTGFDEAQRRELALAAQQTPLVVAPNTSVGVVVATHAAADLAKRLGARFEVEIVEAHHRAKKDAPSGTALKLAEEIRRAAPNERSFRLSREGQTGPRPAGEIGIQSIRGGDVVGEHTVYFLADGERVELTHRATSRDAFARGALQAAAWVVKQPPGLYGMEQVLGLDR